MGHKKEDRRIQRTKQLLREALVSLILERRYETITVQDILDRANVGRSTFYAHFRDKEELLLSGFYELEHDLHAHIREEVEEQKEAGTLSCLSLFQHAESNHRFYKAMVGSKGIEIVVKTGTEYIRIYLREQINQLGSNSNEPVVPIPVLVNTLTGALMSLLRWWLDNDMPHSPEQMDDMFRQMAMPGVRNVLKI